MLLKIGYEPRKDADEINKFSSSVGADLGLVLAKDQPVPHQYRVLSLHGPPSGLKGVARVIKDVYKKNHTHQENKHTHTDSDQNSTWLITMRRSFAEAILNT